MKKIILVLLTVTSLGCSNAMKEANREARLDAKDARSWASQMQQMAKNLEKLMPYVFSREEFSDAKNRAQVQELVTEYSQSVQHVPEHMGKKLLGDDPLVKYYLDNLKDGGVQAVKAFNEGHLDYSRNVLKDSVGACFNCHTTTQLGPENRFSTAKLSSTFRIYPTEKADFYVATRQYDQAISVLEDVLDNPKRLAEQPHEQVLAMKKYLALMVRVRKEPTRASETISRYLKNGNPPYFVAQEAESWLKSLRKWAGEKRKQPKALQKAKELLAQASRAQAGAYQAGYVENLRATALLHEALKDAKKPADKADIYRLLGDSYDIVSDLGMWDLPEAYYEACVRTAPKSKVAQGCYRNYERSIVMGFSGSAGVFIPAEERRKMSELKDIAFVGAVKDLPPDVSAEGSKATPGEIPATSALKPQGVVPPSDPSAPSPFKPTPNPNAPTPKK